MIPPFLHPSQARLRARLLSLMTAIVLLSACAGEDRMEHANRLAAHDLHFRAVTTDTFRLAAWVRLRDPSQPVTVYIEGDGAAYDANGYPSRDPTPRTALALSLAATDPSANVIYLARPCQYLHDPQCQPADWTTHRFDEPALKAQSDALDRLIPKGARLHLIGYSGGADIAAVLAARRSDAASLRTIAGNLDPYGVNRLHATTEKLMAVDPLGVATQLTAMPQRHFVGRRDRVVPAEIAQRFIAAEGPNACVKTTVVDADHESGWLEAWPTLLTLPLLSCPHGR